jgi:CO/xanthine dehydrogenase FAD-binding subunit
VPEGEAILADGPINVDTLARAARAAEDAAKPIDDLRGSARYRKAMVHNLARRALDGVWSRLEGRR